MEVLCALIMVYSDHQERMGDKKHLQEVLTEMVIVSPGWMVLTKNVRSESKIKVSTIYFFSQKISLDLSCESSAEQTIHFKYQDLF